MWYSLCDWLQLLVGGGHVELDERLAMIETVGGGHVIASTNTQISLLGGQIGADILLVKRGRLRAECLLKAGLFNNSASNIATTTDAGVPIAKHHRGAIRATTWIASVGALIWLGGLIWLDLTATLSGLSASMLGKLWFIDRMVWIQREQKDDLS